MGQRSVPAPFLTKTYQLVDDRSTDDVISWNENGSTFVVWKTADFAMDLLPKYFKHNNFSSFVRQLNTYGFRKIIPDKWEFSNDNFLRGEKQLLFKIRRRKTVTLVPTQKQESGKATIRGFSSPANSGCDLGSTSTSSPDSKNPGSLETSVTPSQFAGLTGENKKLWKDNEILSSELAQTRKQCDELIAFLTEYVKIEPDQINRIMRQGTCESSRGGSGGESDGDDKDNMKLFGVWLKGEKKRGRDEKIGADGVHDEEKKELNFHAFDWIKSRKICNRQ